MAKFTVSQSHVDQYPELAKYLGKTVDASILQGAKSSAKAAKKDTAKAGARQNKNSVPATPENANIVLPAPKKTAKKSAGKGKGSKKNK